MTMNRYIPRGNNLVVKSREIAEKTKWGIFIPETAKETMKDPIAIVIEVGVDVKEFKVGDLVIPCIHSVQPIPGVANMFILNEEQILCKVEEHIILN